MILIQEEVVPKKYKVGSPGRALVSSKEEILEIRLELKKSVDAGLGKYVVYDLERHTET